MNIPPSKENKKDIKTAHNSLTNSKDLLLIFTRNPELGKCKTRLAATIGEPSALEVYKLLLQHTANITNGLNVNKRVYYSESIWEDDVWDKRIYDKKIQQGDSLGERMAQAFSEGFSSGFEKIIIIGSDMLDLSRYDIENAFSALDESDFVIGPAEDGGYYLLGMKSFKSRLFQDKEWGKDTVFADSMMDLQTEKVNVLATKNDIDVYEDIKDIDVFQPFLKHL